MATKAFNERLNERLASAPSLDVLDYRIKLDVTVPVNQPSELMLCVFENGAWEIAFDGDTDWMSDGAPPSNQMVQAIPITALVNDLKTFIKERQAEGATIFDGVGSL